MFKRRNIILSFILSICLIVGLCGCQPASGDESDLVKISDLQSEFAKYKEVDVSAKPSIPDYKTDRDLSNIINKDKFEFAQD